MTTNGGMNALSFCLMAWENPETPLLLKALVIPEFSASQRIGLKVLEFLPIPLPE
jgi:hypothetical protein